MNKLLLLALVGLGAQLVDGSLGMAAALAYSIKEYRANRELDEKIIAEAEKEPSA